MVGEACPDRFIAKGHEQHVQRYLEPGNVDPEARKHEEGGEQVGLPSMDLVGQLQPLSGIHAVDVDVRLDHHGLRDHGHLVEPVKGFHGRIYR
jgi:hypothetical protein